MKSNTHPVRTLLALCIGAMLISGCQVDLQGKDACDAPAHCLPGFTCNMERGRCEPTQAPAECPDGFDDCNDDPTDECETVLHDDDDNCGACGVRCGSEEACFESACTYDAVMLAGRANLQDLVVDATHVYWIEDRWFDDLGNERPGALFRMPLSGGEVELLVGEQPRLLHIAHDETHVYWSKGDGSLWRLDKLQPETPEQLDTADGFGISGIALNSTRVYWRKSSTIYSTTKTGTDPIEFAADLETTFTVDDDFLYWMVSLADTDGSWRAPADGSGAPEPFGATGPTVEVYELQRHGDMLFVNWETGGSAITAMPVAGGSSLNVFFHEERSLSKDAVAVDDDLYVVTFGTSDEPTVDLWRASFEPGAPTKLYSSPGGTYGAIAVGADYVYWINSELGTINRFPRGGAE